jgi:hypothetical protein
MTVGIGLLPFPGQRQLAEWTVMANSGFRMVRRFFALVGPVVLLSGVVPGVRLLPAAAVGPVTLSTLGVAYTQNFDTLPASGSATWANDSTIPGWFHARTGTGSTIVANDGSSSSANLYSYGTGTATDRALGGVSDTGPGSLFWGVRLNNGTGGTITSLAVAYTGEQWRNSAAAGQQLAFSYLVGNPSVTGTLAEFQTAGVGVAALNFSSPVSGGAAGARDGNAAANRTAKSFTIAGLSIPIGSDVMLRWSDPDIGGVADHGLAIDDLSVTPNATPVALSSLGVAHTQNFNTLPATAAAAFTNDFTIPGWFYARTGSAQPGLRANDGSTNLVGIYSYGTGTATERALGSIGGSDFNDNVGNVFFGVQLHNDTGSTITSLAVAYTGEQWRNSAAAAQTVSFSYLVGNPSVTGTVAEFQTAGVAVTALDFTSPVTGGTAGARDGNAAANRTAKSFTITGLSIPINTDVMLRWSDPDHTGNDHGLAIDDFSVTPWAELTGAACSYAIVAGPPKHIDFTVQDTGSGIASIATLSLLNMVTPIPVPAFTVGTTAPVIFTATKADQTQRATIAVVITDRAGNQSSCI